MSMTPYFDQDGVPRVPEVGERDMEGHGGREKAVQGMCRRVNMTRDELISRLDRDFSKETADRLADLLLELTQPKPVTCAADLAPPPKTRGQEVADQCFQRTAAGKLPMTYGEIAALIDAERADAARAERERCAKALDGFDPGVSTIGPLHTAGMRDGAKCAMEFIRNLPEQK